MSVERWAFKNLNVQGPIAFANLDASKNELDALFNLLDCLDDVVEVRPVAGVEFGMEQFAIGADFESAAARGN